MFYKKLKEKFKAAGGGVKRSDMYLWSVKTSNDSRMNGQQIQKWAMTI